MPGELGAAAGIERRQGFGLYRGQLLGEGVDVQDRALQLVEGPAAGSMANNWSTWQRSPSKAVSGSVTVVVMTASPHFER